jgi:rRNA-processing protein FCF1
MQKRKILLDTNFILTCIRNKIDFFNELKNQGFEIITPKQVIEEIKRIIESKKKYKFREEAEISMKILNKNKFSEINLQGKNVDKAIIKYALQNTNLIIATLDREIKSKIKNKVMIIRNKKILMIL